MKTLTLVLFALFAVACSESIDPNWEPEPTCVIPEATWTYEDDRIVCGPGAEPYDATTAATSEGMSCYWRCASFKGVCGTEVAVHVAFGVEDPFIAWDEQPEGQCQVYPGVEDESQPQPTASLAD